MLERNIAKLNNGVNSKEMDGQLHKFLNKQIESVHPDTIKYLSTTFDESKIHVEFIFMDESTKNATFKFIKKQVQIFLKRKNLKGFELLIRTLTPEEEATYEQILEPLSIVSLIKISNLLFPFSSLTKEEWLENTKTTTLEEKTLRLRAFFYDFIFDHSLRSAFPFLNDPRRRMKCAYVERIGQNLLNKTLYIQAQSVENAKKFIKKLENFTKIMTKIFHFTNEENFSEMQEVYHEVCVNNIIHKLKKNSTEEHLWYNLSYLVTLIEDSLDDFDEIISQNNILSYKSNEFYNFVKKLEHIFKDLTFHEQSHLIGSTLELMPDKSALMTLSEEQKRMSTLLTCNQLNLVKVRFLVIDEKTALFEEKPNKSRPIKETRTVSENPAVNNTQNETLLSPFFPSTEESSLTALCKKEAETKLNKEAKRLNKKIKQSIVIEKEPSEVNQEESNESTFLYLLNQEGEISQIEAIPLKNTLNLYLALSEAFLAEEDYQIFTPILRDPKILNRSGLGNSGIKIYGSYGVFVKSLKTTDRLFCKAFPLLDGKGYAFIPHAIFTHAKYEKFINHVELLVQYAQKEDAIYIASSQEIVEVLQPGQGMSLK